jgi:hypothetical protein
MAEEKPDALKSIEMRLAAIEDRISRLHVTEEEMRAFHKVSALMGGGQVAAAPASGMEAAAIGGAQALTPNPDAVIPRSRFINRFINRQIVRQICVECNECGPCACGGGFGGFSGGGGFGGFGT